jgi:hypothetical protein
MDTPVEETMPPLPLPELEPLPPPPELEPLLLPLPLPPLPPLPELEPLLPPLPPEPEPVPPELEPLAPELEPLPPPLPAPGAVLALPQPIASATARAAQYVVFIPVPRKDPSLKHGPGAHDGTKGCLAIRSSGMGKRIR